MKQYQAPVAELLSLANEDVMAASLIADVGTVISFGEGQEVDPGM